MNEEIDYSDMCLRVFLVTYNTVELGLGALVTAFGIVQKSDIFADHRLKIISSTRSHDTLLIILFACCTGLYTIVTSIVGLVGITLRNVVLLDFTIILMRIGALMRVIFFLNGVLSLTWLTFSLYVFDVLMIGLTISLRKTIKLAVKREQQRKLFNVRQHVYAPVPLNTESYSLRLEQDRI
jgi:hypothetical protein